MRSQLIQIAIAGACSGNVMLLALAIYCGQWSGMAAEHLQLLRVASTAVGLVSLLGPGSLFFRGAWSAIRTRTPHMDLPVALGLGVGAISGAWNTLVGSGELYYDSLSMLVFFLLIGRALQAWQQRSACEAVAPSALRAGPSPSWGCGSCFSSWPSSAFLSCRASLLRVTSLSLAHPLTHPTDG